MDSTSHASPFVAFYHLFTTYDHLTAFRLCNTELTRRVQKKIAKEKEKRSFVYMRNVCHLLLETETGIQNK